MQIPQYDISAMAESDSSLFEHKFAIESPSMTNNKFLETLRLVRQCGELSGF
jgi:hypothetical protein